MLADVCHCKSLYDSLVPSSAFKSVSGFTRMCTLVDFEVMTPFDTRRMS